MIVVVAMDEEQETILFYQEKGSGWTLPWKFTQGNVVDARIAGEIVHNQTGIQTERDKTQELNHKEKNGSHTYLNIRIIVTPIKMGAPRTENDCKIKYMLRDEMLREKITPLCKKVIQYLETLRRSKGGA